MLLDDVVFDVCQCSDARPISTDLHYLSVTANSTKQGRPISLFEWELEHLTDHKHSRHSNDDFHSGLPTPVLLLTTFTWRIKLHYQMLTPGSNYLL